MTIPTEPIGSIRRAPALLDAKIAARVRGTALAALVLRAR